MKTYLLDTTTCSAILDKRPLALSQFNAAIGRSLVYINFYVYAELMYLIANSKYKDLNRIEVDRLLRDVTTLHSNEGISKTYAKLKVRLKNKLSQRKSSSQQNFDPQIIGLKERHLWIISTALYYRATLVTCDGVFSNKRVTEVARFKLENWTNPGMNDLENDSE